MNDHIILTSNSDSTIRTFVVPKATLTVRAIQYDDLKESVQVFIHDAWVEVDQPLSDIVVQL